MTDLTGKTAFITGAARGIGAETARRLIRRGANVALADVRTDLLEPLVASLGDQAVAFEADVRDWDSLERAVEGAVERFGGLDVVMANAGVAPIGPVQTIDPADWERTIDVNLLGVFRTVRVALPHVLERRGYFLLVASLAAQVHAPFMSHYAAAKAGVEALGDSLRIEVAHQGVGVGVAYFGFIDTDMVREAEQTPEVAGLRDRGPGIFTQAVPVQVAAEASVRGMERRGRRVVAPRGVLPVVMTPGVSQRISELGVRGAVPQAIRTAVDNAAKRPPVDQRA
ncbi:MAG TPA: short-chain dehydrogenase/reductase [Solirubrobacteraceae bacterium]|nr:short-chain dehydrogenase/reductase [Solirubrobacteraceae bacterium]